MKKNNEERRILVFDTTLRDGEQSPGASMTVDGKLRVAQQLARMKVDTIEAGFPISSPVQFEAVKQVAQKVKGPVITGLSRALKKDIDACYEAVKYSGAPGIHTFIATSDIHLKHKLNIDRSRCIELAIEAVRYAKKKLDYVQFSAEDATRTDWAFLADVVRAVIKAGAKVVNLPDTVGYAIPSEYAAMVRYILTNVPEANDIVISVHCHNDLGLAVANSLSAVEAGATQVEGAINGIGERAGNAAIEEIVMSLYVRRPYFQAHTNVKTEELYNASRLVTAVTGIHLQPNKAIVGENAFSHEAGIHQDGVIKNKQTYEIMDPKTIGVPSNRLVLGRHSGKHGFLKRVEELGLKIGKADVEKYYLKFLDIADKKKQVYDDDLFTLFSEDVEKTAATFDLKYFHAMSGNSVIPNAIVTLVQAGKEMTESAVGDGPVDAVYTVIRKITGLDVKLIDYRITSVTSGKEAQGEVAVVVEVNGRKFSGQSARTDIVEASARAFIAAINRFILTGEVSPTRKKRK
jgi:2-isopropylmalate synthase